jgi:hypothetical protein
VHKWTNHLVSLTHTTMAVLVLTTTILVLGITTQVTVQVCMAQYVRVLLLVLV